MSGAARPGPEPAATVSAARPVSGAAVAPRPEVRAEPPGGPRRTGQPDGGRGPAVAPPGPGPRSGTAVARANPDGPRAAADEPAEPDRTDPVGDAPEASPSRSDLRRQLSEQRRLRTIALVLASLLVLGALPLFFGIRAATRDPVFNALDALAVPAWAETSTVDGVSGSRWCLLECRFRERTVQSANSWQETAEVYQAALAREGWQRWEVALCPEQPVQDQHYSCWRRDELTLDLWVRTPVCPTDQPDGVPPVAPSPGADATPPADPSCTGSIVSIKVRNAIADERTGPRPTTDPSLTGEDPEPIFTEDPLGGLLPSTTPS